MTPEIAIGNPLEHPLGYDLLGGAIKIVFFYALHDPHSSLRTAAPDLSL